MLLARTGNVKLELNINKTKNTSKLQALMGHARLHLKCIVNNAFEIGWLNSNGIAGKVASWELLNSLLQNAGGLLSQLAE